MLLIEHILRDQRRDGLRRGDLHLEVDVLRAHIERAAEDAREREEVVDLVREVRAPRADDARARLFRERRHDLRRRVRHGHDDGVLIHRAHHLLRHAARDRHADEDIRAPDDILERALLLLEIRDLRDRVLVGIHALRTARVDGALRVAEDDMLRIHRLQQARDGLPRGARAVDDDLRVLEPLADELERVDERRDADDRRAVLVVVEHGDVELLAQARLDVEALRRLDILEVDAAERRRHELDRAHDLVHVLRVEADGDGVDAGEALEENRFALHDGQACARANVAEAEHGRAVRDDGDHVALRRVVVDHLRVLLDLEARRGDARRVRERQVLRAPERHFADNFVLALAFFMQA